MTSWSVAQTGVTTSTYSKETLPGLLEMFESCFTGGSIETGFTVICHVYIPHELRPAALYVSIYLVSTSVNKTEFL